MYSNKFALFQEDDEESNYENDTKVIFPTEDKSLTIEKINTEKIIKTEQTSNILDTDHPYFRTRNITQNPDIKYSGIILNDTFPETAFIDINNNNIYPKLIDKNVEASDLENFEYKIPNHWGQRKLLLAEIYFLTQIYEDKEIIVIYAGAAPGTHLPILVSMFPKITFHLYDPKRFDSCLNLYNNVIVNLYYDNINYRPKEGKNKKYGYFTTDVAEWYANEYFDKGIDFYFISDIRTVPKSINYSSNDFTSKFEKEVMRNQTEQMNWISIMKPRLSMLKFKTPYPTIGKDQYYKYLRGQIHLQVWSPTSSSETRLFVSLDDLDYTGWYDVVCYERKLAYYNYLRQHTFNDTPIPFLEDETLESWWVNFVDNVTHFTIDFYNELLILKNYYDKFIKSKGISLREYLSRQIIDITNLLNIIYIEAQPENDKEIKDYKKIFRLRKSVNDVE
jgi:hypothetical protein